MNKLKNLISKFKRDAKRNILAISAASTAAIAVQSAAADDPSNKIVTSIINIIIRIFFYIGIILLAWSVGMLVLAFKNEDADSKSRAIMLMIVSVILIALRPIMAGVLSAAGFNTAEVNSISAGSI